MPVVCNHCLIISGNKSIRGAMKYADFYARGGDGLLFDLP